MKNSLSDLHNHLFVALERINDESIDKETLAMEMDRSKAVCCIAREITANAKVILDAAISVGSIPEQIRLPDLLR